jgi:hypothetical protein
MAHQMPTGESMKTLLTAVMLGTAAFASAHSISVGAAPAGDVAKVANRIIKENHPACKHVSNAKRRPDGAIAANCSGSQFLVFTVFNPKEGRTIELAMNCTAAKQQLGIAC